ncbi:MAG: GWxTD domain-containing protein [Bacteroidales bacterium]|nr:GWxTD domain-containing protein [Bacteroidales bacterium]
MKSKLIIILISIVTITSCITQKPKEGTKTGASKYNPASYVLHPQFKVFHETDSYSKLYIKLFTKELRFSSTNEQRINQATVKVKYKIIPSVRSKTILDSAQTSIKIKKVKNQTSVISFFKIKNINAEQYIIEIKLVDLYGNKKSLSYITINKSDDGNEQYYLSLKAKNQKPIFTEYFKSSDTLHIKSKNTNIKQMSVVYYKTRFKNAEKPFVITEPAALNSNPDSSWNIPVKTWKAEFTGKKTGIYIIRADTAKIKGMLKVQFETEYPIISKSIKMLDALQYLLTEEEFEKMQNSDNKKLSIDNFWIKTTGSKERARELIKIWYNRATYSNYYFTSYKEGRKTDRGMIYMLFGPPDDIQYFDDAEKWIYIDTKEDTKLNFVFVKQINSISNNDYTLIRESKYQVYWNKAVKYWRAGKVYRY